MQEAPAPSAVQELTDPKGLGAEDSLWYKDAVLYEVHVRAFSDSDADGIGDFRGLKDRLDYLQDLGVSAIWLLPFYPSPLRDDGYDIADYNGVHPSYGTLADVRAFVRAAHDRGLRVITELVCNHTSDQHPWFQRARRAKPGSAARDFYVFSDTADRYRDARIIFKDFERSNWTWDPVANAYYWHRFFSHQPDLNFEHKEVRRSLFKAMDFWLGLGIDGLRLDAVPYLYEREGTSCENLPETHAFLKELRRHVDGKFRDRMLLAEANQWPEEAVPYFGQGDECHMAFHFPLMPRLFMAIHMEDRFPIIEILRQTPAIPDSCQWALFLRNHDELTLEMVTDEERDYMYRVYARDRQARINLGIRRRLAPLLGNHRRKIELMNGLLFSLPGTPVLYYGDEIGMGDNIYLGDRNGVRTPMQWSADRNAGFSRANPQRLYLPVIIDPEYHYEAINVEAQQNNHHSLLWWMKRLIALRKRYRAFGRGSLTFLQPDNPKVLVYLRHFEDERILVVANLSRFSQYAEIDLSAYQGQVPVELFGRIEFPPIRSDRPYLLTLGPHAFHWFSLERPRAPQASLGQAPGEPAPALPSITIEAAEDQAPDDADWLGLLAGAGRQAIEELLPDYLPRCRWFGGKARRIKTTRLAEIIPLPDRRSCLSLVTVEYGEGPQEGYVLPLALALGEQAALRAQAAGALCWVRSGALTGVLYDPLGDATQPDPDLCRQLLQVTTGRRRLCGEAGEVQAVTHRALRTILGPVEHQQLDPVPCRGEQSNTSIVYGDKLMVKLLRRIESGPHPEAEILPYLQQHGFTHAPQLGATLEYQHEGGDPVTLALVLGFVHSEGDAWRYTMDALSHFYDRALARGKDLPAGAPSTVKALLDRCPQESPEVIRETMGAYLESARLLGQRTAELHLTLGADTDDPAFGPEPFTPFYQRSIYQSMRNLTSKVLQTLRRALPGLPAPIGQQAQRVLDAEAAIGAVFQLVHETKVTAQRIRHHGDLHLGQVLYTGKDFVIIDYEGEPARPLSERRIKRSPLRDVAGMLRSFQYAAQAALLSAESGSPGGPTGPAGALRKEDVPVLRPWADQFYCWSCAAYLCAYLGKAGQATFLPQNRAELEVLLSAYLLEKAVYELGYELNNRPAWVKIPLDGILQLLGQSVLP